MRVEGVTNDVTVGMSSHYGQAVNVAPAVVPTGAASADLTAKAAAGQVGAPKPIEASEEVTQARPAPLMPGLSAADRGAIATATGFYITAGGKVTPEGMPPWGFIVRFIEQRQSERLPDANAGVDPIEGAAPVLEGEHVDVTV